MALAKEGAELPVALNVSGRRAVVGQAGAAVCRAQPQFACVDFLPHLGTARQWTANRRRIDAGGALAFVCDQIASRIGKAAGVVAALPGYLTSAQRELFSQTATKARWRLLGTVATPVAAALAAYEQLPWSGSAVVGDVDGAGFTWSVVQVQHERIEVVDSQTFPMLGRNAWLGKLIDGAAGRCIRVSRRDPRESAEAEQMLYDQLAERIDGQGDSNALEVTVQTPQWFQNLTLEADDLVAFCAGLSGKTVTASAGLQRAGAGRPATIVLTAAAGRLPGLVAALEGPTRPTAGRSGASESSDFGDNLLFDEVERSPTRVHVLAADAVARAAHELAGRIQAGDQAGGRIESVALSDRPAADEGPPRLQFEGRDFPLARLPFVIGADADCDLAVEAAGHPMVSKQHCEIVLERRHHVVRDRGRAGTFVNEVAVAGQMLLRPGDSIRLGPGGPVLRFLGRVGDARRFVTTA